MTVVIYLDGQKLRQATLYHSEAEKFANALGGKLLGTVRLAEEAAA